MKAKINGIELEGTAEEIAKVLAMNAVAEREEKKSTAQVTSKASLSDSVEDKESSENYLPGTDKFLTALFRYSPSKTSMGRQAYVVQLLATGKTFSIRNLAKRSNTNFHSAAGAIRRAAEAGCVIEVSNSASVDERALNSDTKVRMISLGTIKQALEIKKSYHLKSQTDAVRYGRKEPDVKILDTGSAPITKIKYTEGS